MLSFHLHHHHRHHTFGSTSLCRFHLYRCRELLSSSTSLRFRLFLLKIRAAAALLTALRFLCSLLALSVLKPARSSWTIRLEMMKMTLTTSEYILAGLEGWRWRRDVHSPCSVSQSLRADSAIARTAYEDTYLTLFDVDGLLYTDKLRKRMHDANAEPYLTAEQSWLLTKGEYLL